MVVEAPETVFSQLQFVALALPAVAIYLRVLTNLYTEPEEVGDLANLGVVLLTVAAAKRDFFFGVASLMLFVLAALALVGRLLYAQGFLIDAGTDLMAAALVLFLVSLIFTLWHSLGEILGGEE